MIARKSVRLGIAVLLAASFVGTAQMVQAAEPCSSCADCQAKLASGLWPTVVLTADIIDHAGDCIGLNFGESDVIFDCNGHVIDGDEIYVNSERGISIRHGSNITITNCTISDFDSGIFLVEAAGNLLTGNRLVSNHKGIEMIHVESNVVSNNRVSGNVTGIKISDANFNQLLSNTVCGNSLWDIYYSNGLENVGEANTCDKTYFWNEGGTPGCTFACSVFVDGFESGDCGVWTLVSE